MDELAKIFGDCIWTGEKAIYNLGVCPDLYIIDDVPSLLIDRTTPKDSFHYFGIDNYAVICKSCKTIYPSVREMYCSLRDERYYCQCALKTLYTFP